MSGDWHQHLRWRDLVPLFRRYNNSTNRAEYILEQYSPLLEGRILDVCCGLSSAYYRQAIGERYEGLDISDSYKYDDINEGGPTTEEARPNHVCNVERQPLPFPDMSFDTVLCIGALEHLDNIHDTYSELFRVAKSRVLIQLPNNWPGFFSSMLRGRNYTHRAGYGLGPQPKRPGERHKYWFNLEEACEFLVGRMPAGWDVERLDCTFEMGSDSWLSSRLFTKIARFTWRKGVRKIGKPLAVAATLVRPFVYYPVRLAEWLFGLLIWGWRGRVAYHNMTCREVYAVFRRR